MHLPILNRICATDFLQIIKNITFNTKLFEKIMFKYVHTCLIYINISPSFFPKNIRGNTDIFPCCLLLDKKKNHNMELYIVSCTKSGYDHFIKI